MMTHWLLAAGFAGMGIAIFFLGWSARIMRVEWRDDRALRAAEARYERHTHRKGDALPVAGRIPLERLADPEPLPGESAWRPVYLPGEPPWEEQPADVPHSDWIHSDWHFAGGWDQGPVAESAEYELLTQTTEQPAIGSLDWCVERLAEVRADERAERIEAGERPIDTGELLAITNRVESWIAQWTAQGNVDRHTIQAGE